MHEGRQDAARSPRKRNFRDKDQTFGRNASGNRRHRNSSRSRSPSRRVPSAPAYRPPPSPPYHRQSSQHSPSKHSGFPPGTASQGQPVCALCLATDPHDTRKCRSDTLWDGSKARCRKSKEGRLITPAGTILCSDWNNCRRCSSSLHEQQHECSGCGSKDHGAQGCPRAQKK